MEQKNSILFQELANKIVISDVKNQLLLLSHGNDKQSKILIDISTHLGNFKKNQMNVKEK